LDRQWPGKRLVSYNMQLIDCKYNRSHSTAQIYLKIIF
jgi:hypothetical protein